MPPKPKKPRPKKPSSEGKGEYLTRVMTVKGKTVFRGHDYCEPECIESIAKRTEEAGRRMPKGTVIHMVRSTGGSKPAGWSGKYAKGFGGIKWGKEQPKPRRKGKRSQKKKRRKKKGNK